MRKIALVACLLTVCITAASAYIRHWQAGLGCVERPDCRVVATTEVVPGEVQTVGQAMQRVVSGEAPQAVSLARALHRLTATLVGLLVVVIGFIGWSRLPPVDRAAIALAVALTVALAWVGLYAAHATPLVTLGNVLGGFALGGALAWVAAGRGHAPASQAAPGPQAARGRGAQRAWAALAVVFVIAAVGVLIAARETGDVDATRLHLAHRALAFVLAALIAGVLIASARRAPVLAAGLGAALVLQIVLGLTNAFSQTPLVAATVHNAVAATIVALLAAILRRAARPSFARQP